ncbi:YlmC/YmxH family sporulation protein [Alkalicoccobacillus murimartini]|uniref:YlmC/YmxH family sporulation protein n=1 Tax=Alkalicoccobacillus murimartini TaxID=171685 RepID=A0ABT9YF11_9BACI|nr:YlmC/YmxH family sporulation protein [Alkalicoccobacillus murimartini]MDQ0206436.1 YlmC/YmxH family sporulation protein [Alkalicoccobacillus murimartini]
MMKISDLQAKDIVNLETGKRLGHLTDLDLNLDSGQIESIIISSTGKVMSLFGKDEEVVIPWTNIIKIGSDVILVKMTQPFRANPTQANFVQKPSLRTTKQE